MMKNTRTLPALAAFSAAFALSTAASSAAVIFGPTDISVPITANAGPDTNVTTVTSAQLNGQDQLFITYGVTRPNFDSNADGWLALSINDNGEGLFDFNGTYSVSGVQRPESDLGVLIRANNVTAPASPGNHSIFHATAGSWDNATSADIQNGTLPTTHQVRLTLSGLASGGFTGSHAFTVEVDHNASTFGTADRTFTGTMSFASRPPSTDEGLRLELRSATYAHTATDFTVFQADAVPEPSSALLGGLGLLALLRRRR